MQALRRTLAQTATAVAVLHAGLAAGAANGDPSVSADPHRLLTEMVERFQQVIVLAESDRQLTPAEQEQATVVGRYLFSRSRDAQADWLRRLEDGSAGPTEVEGLLTELEQGQTLRDADRLAFQDLLAELDAWAQTLADDAARLRLVERIARNRQTLDQILTRYEKEIGNVYRRLGTRAAPPERESWDRYLAALRARHDPRAILRANEAITRGLPVGRGQAKRKPDPRSELSWSSLPPKTLVLTFDDGPHARYTDRIRELLAQQNIPAIFFHVGQNLGSVNAGRANLSRSADAARRLIEAGIEVGNHSFSHPVLTSLSAPARASEIANTNLLLTELTARTPKLFRPPYGAINDEVAQAAQAAGLRTLLWNIDSKDWADPLPASIVRRVLSLADEQGRGVILFHDIQEKTVRALPYVLEGLKEAGFRFAHWDGTAFITPDSPAAIAEDQRAVYRRSWAVVIGIDDYAKWPRLRYAVNDAQAIRELLVNRFGFAQDQVIMLLNGDARRERIMSVLADELGSLDKVKRDDRVLVFYAGHGATRQLPGGKDMGYIVPVDADPAKPSQWVSMADLQQVADGLPAKHVLFVMDSCYSGLGLTRAGRAASGRNYLAEIGRRNARQMLTAGGADEEVADSGPNGHSIFTWTLLQGLNGEGDLNQDGFITASELAAYASPVVSSLSRQTPAFGSLPGSEGGEFVFELRKEPEYLSEASAQLDEDAIRLNQQIAEARAQVAAKARRNRELNRQLAEIQRGATAGGSAAPGSSAASRKNDEGMAHYKAKRYPEALAAFHEAARLDPTQALAANNVGFVLFRLERFEEAAVWLEKAIALDPKRAVAYANLGDCYVHLNRREQARAAFEQNLKLAPNSRQSAEIRARLDALL